MIYEIFWSPTQSISLIRGASAAWPEDAPDYELVAAVEASDLEAAKQQQHIMLMDYIKTRNVKPPK